jgi:DAACS family dicarboxylate/amino acid:cation (Na+ or H+) symporter
MSMRSTHSVTRYIIVAMLLGMLAGVVAGEAAKPLGIVGSLYIQLIKVVAIPLVFVSIIEALLSTSLSWHTARRWIGVIAINTTCALIIGLCIANLIQPGVGFVIRGAVAPTTKDFSLAAFLDSLIPKSIVSPFAENNVIATALMALLIGVTLRRYVQSYGMQSTGAELSQESAERGVRILSAIVNEVIIKLVALVPVAVFCVTAKTVGESGFAPFRGLFFYIAAASLGLLLQASLVYPWWITRVGGISLSTFLRAAARPVANAFGTNSSLATVPLTLQALDNLGVPKSASRLATCIGTNLNNDGILLYETMAVLFVAQALGIELSLGEQVFAAGMSVLAAIGVAGVPEAGVVSLSLVLSAVGLPLEVVPLLLSVDWIVARMRSVVNVLSDMTVSIAVGGRCGGVGAHPL